MKKTSIPDVIDEFHLYYKKHPVWGSLHIVLDDGNVDDRSVEFCIDYAHEHDDQEGERLGRVLLKMSKTQRRKLPYEIERRKG
jgi:hypothetical protein